MASTTGRRVVEYLTNKSGGGVVAGDVVIVDTSNNEAFTTTTTSGYTGTIGVAQETIANNAAGRILTAGYAALVTPNASVTRGNFGKTHTVAKQATDGGSSRVAGAFCQFLTGGTTPSAHLFGLADATAASATVPTAHGCRVTRASTGFSVGNNVYTAVAFDAETYDTDTMHDTVTNNTRITIPSISGVTTGLWSIKASGYTDAGSGRSDCQFRINGSTGIGFNIGGAFNVVSGYIAAVDYVLSATDYIECLVRTSGGAGNVAYDAAGSPLFEVAFLGKVT